MVGLHEAYIHLLSTDGSFYKRKDLLYWGRRTNYKENSRFFFKALSRREALSCLVSETVGSSGKVARYEWLSAGL